MADKSQDPANLVESVKRPAESELSQEPSTAPTQPVLPAATAATEGDKLESNGAVGNGAQAAPEGSEEPAAKRVKLDEPEAVAPKTDARDKVRGITLVKPE